MDKLPNERDDSGLQSVFVSVFPITDFRGISQLDFVDFSIGNWECKCGHLKGLHHLRTACVHCGAMVITDPFLPGDVLCQKCGTYNKNTPDFCNKCGDPVSLQLKYDQQECEERGMTFSAPLKVTVRLTIYEKDAERHQGAGGVFRRHSADDAERHLYRERHGAGDCFAASPLAGRLL
jgi:DNA-directed RNA polymerase subunit beta